MPKDDVFRNYRELDWLRSVRANYTPQRIDTTSKDAGDFSRGCQHPRAELIKGSKYRIKCPDCRRESRV